MTAVEFCYWLQGYFEVTGDEPARHGGLTTRQEEIIARHLQLVQKVDGEHDNAFVAWLGLGPTMPPEHKIRRMLAGQFRHVIDPSYHGAASGLQAVHDGEAPHPLTDYTPYRC